MALRTQKASASRWTHDVFLSFKGADTCKGIVSYLYHELQHVQGIRTFKDDREIEKGTTISPELLSAIENSHIAVVGLSPNYASFTWCLEELTKILQCMKGKGTVLPIFYNVDPSNVRKHTGSFAEHFTNHGERFREDIGKVKRWKDALTKVANISGFNPQTHESERKLIEDVVKWACSKVHRTFTLLDSTELVGNKFRCEQVDFLLASDADDRDQDEWKSELEKLQKIPKSTIFDALKISYDGLDEMNKRIFLDIAHFHKGKDKEEVIEILDTYCLYGLIGVDALIQKSLLTMEKSQFHISYINVEMHDLVQQMALEIVHQKSCTGEPGERVHLCHPEDIFQVFINNTGTSQIEA
ncbi:TMV resistance protein N-like [Malus domestica]|uniref:TMV resistance protein N-like n=1 Tax=Malus domestica TaxID=3750 RepID=UPI00397680CF